MDNGQLTILVSLRDLLKVFAEGDTFIVHCQFSILNESTGCCGLWKEFLWIKV